MAIYLVQHGKNLPKDQDPEQPLSEPGTEAVKDIAERAKQAGVRVDKIEHSPKLRAKQTAEIFGKALEPKQGIQERSGIKALDDVTAIARELDPETNLMLVGHLPFMEKLVAYCITGNQDRLVMKFQNGGIVCLDQEKESGQWYIKWNLVPDLS